MQVLSQGCIAVRCRDCGCRFTILPDDCFKRYEVCGMIHSGLFDRTLVVYTRCPTCRKRIDVTGRVAVESVTGDDPLCKCTGGGCRCE